MTIITVVLIFSGCGSNENKTFSELHKIASEKCNNRNGELIFFGKVMNEQTFEWHYEMVCYKEDERHFYYEFV